MRLNIWRLIIRQKKGNFFKFRNYVTNLCLLCTTLYLFYVIWAKILFYILHYFIKNENTSYKGDFFPILNIYVNLKYIYLAIPLLCFIASVNFISVLFFSRHICSFFISLTNQEFILLLHSFSFIVAFDIFVVYIYVRFFSFTSRTICFYLYLHRIPYFFLQNNMISTSC